ncbi:hypothetical protein JTE90_004344 [Oedothorax gibbosus]|uniref:Regulator of microtubule dynamics protein 1 n=1 Tax=Oedothorax gibbosus TaxID=931172 RepID=A0AAV6VKB8_9ARAC|nr:hypothetical protein JTE90_004344 [Oedothorax gibbosus]
MQGRTAKNFTNLALIAAQTRKNFFIGNSPKHIYFRINKHIKSQFSASNCILSFLPGLFLVKAMSKTDKTETNKVIKVADELYNDAKYEELYSVLDVHRDSQEPEILWRLARAVFEKCRNVKENNEKLSCYEDALQLVDKALEINEGCSAAHKWRAIVLDYVWQCKSTKGRIIHSFDVKKHMERAVELNPQDSTSYYLLGKWCYTFADMPWYQRQVAAAIFASPPTSSYEEALRYFEKAESISPSFYSMNLLMIGKCFLNINETDKGVVYIKKAMNYPIKTPDDKEAHDEAEKILQKLNAL